MKVLRFFVPGIAFFLLGLYGCGFNQFPTYPSDLKYVLREDPVVLAKTAELGDERYEPDRPGLFPLMQISDTFKADNPLFPLIKKKLAATVKRIISEENNGSEVSEQEFKAKEDGVLAEYVKHRKKFDAALDPILRDPANIPAELRKKLETALEALFGTPAKPTVNAKLASLSAESVATLKLDDAILAEGSTRYRIHCLHCHGVAGDGRGPTARWINPHPRDFRLGKFKFQSVNQSIDGIVGRPPAREDLLRTLRHGLEGTAMPSFNLLGEAELESLVSYVIHLSIRGQVEKEIISEKLGWNEKEGALEWTGVDEETDAPTDPLDEVKKKTKRIIAGQKTSWMISQDKNMAIMPAPYPYKEGDIAELKASVKRGQLMFTANAAPEFVQEYYDRYLNEEFEKKKLSAEKDGKKWTASESEKAKKDIEAESGKALKQKAVSRITGANCVSCHADYGRQAKFRFDDWGTLVRPNNFTLGVFRGGRRPIDIYYRVHSGINGSNMTPYGGILDGREIWDLVNFVSNLSYPAMRKTFTLSID